MSPRTAIGALVTSVATLTASGIACRPAPVQMSSGACRDCNVLVVTIDTLRRDRVGAYGGSGGLTPTIDDLAAQGIRFDHAFSHAPMTLPAHSSIMTGLTPRHHGVRNNTAYRLDDRVPTLATLLKGAGRRTGAFVAAFVLDARFGLNRGFDIYDDRLPHGTDPTFHFAERRADDVVKAAGDWILTQAPEREAPAQPAPEHPAPGIQPLAPRTPWFAWVHLFDPHAPYAAPEAYRAGRSAYDAEVAYADAALGRLLARLRAAGSLDRTIVVVTADHGESLGDHGETTHGLFAYDATIRVPLVIRVPGIGAATVATPAAHDDILPTVLDLAALPIPDGLDGQSLARTPSADRPVYFEALDASLTRGWAPLRGVVQNDWKYIDLPEAELYNLSADRAEQHNLARQNPREAVLRQVLAQIDRTPEATSSSAPIDADAANRLRSLGYTGGSSARRTPTDADDPKRLVTLNERFNSALTAFDEGRAAAALTDFLTILEARPDFLTARTSAATVLLSQGRSRDAVQLLRAAPADQQSSSSLLMKLAAGLRDGGDLPGAIALLEEARRRGDESLDLQQDLAISYAAAGRQDAARVLFTNLSQRYPATPTVWFNVGLFEMQSRRPAEAAAAFRHAVEREPAYGEAWQGLGAALVGSNTQDAIAAWKRAEALLPRDYDLLFNLGMVLADSPTPGDAVPYLRRFVAEAPRAHYAPDIDKVRQLLGRIERRPR